MVRFRRKTEQIQVNSEVLTQFKQTCNIIELRWQKHVNDLMRDFIEKEKTAVAKYFRRTIQEPKNPKNIKNANDMMYEIESYTMESEDDTIGSVLVWLRTDMEISRDKVKQIKKELALMGLGMSRFGDLYVAVNSKFLSHLFGTRIYSREFCRHDEYTETKTCDLSGRPTRCMVFDISGGE
ncbi:hypothetical protein KAR91_04735 [Candidatus Pacearchaeota archaeon]|nr:hypothetical protein [Candidatus Pacearchaeota archaeon]